MPKGFFEDYSVDSHVAAVIVSVRQMSYTVWSSTASFTLCLHVATVG